MRLEIDSDRNVRRIRNDQVHIEIQRQGVGHTTVNFGRAAGKQVIDQIRVEYFVDRLIGLSSEIGGGSERNLGRVGDPGESVFRIEAGARIGQVGIRAYLRTNRYIVRRDPDQIVDRTCRECIFRRNVTVGSAEPDVADGGLSVSAGSIHRDAVDRNRLRSAGAIVDRSHRERCP